MSLSTSNPSLCVLSVLSKPRGKLYQNNRPYLGRNSTKINTNFKLDKPETLS